MTSETTERPHGAPTRRSVRVKRHAAALTFIGIVGVLSALAVYTAFGFAPEAKAAPLVIGIPLVILVFLQIVRDIRRVRGGDTTVGSMSEQEQDAYTPPDVDEPTEVEDAASDGDVGAAEEARDAPGAAPPRQSRDTPVWAAGLYVLSLAVLVNLFGMLISTPLFIGGFLRIFGRERWRLVIAYAVCASLAVYALFVGLMDVRLYSGRFGGSLLPWL